MKNDIRFYRLTIAWFLLFSAMSAVVIVVAPAAAAAAVDAVAVSFATLYDGDLKNVTMIQWCLGVSARCVLLSMFSLKFN